SPDVGGGWEGVLHPLNFLVLLDLKGLPFLEEAEICRSEQNRCASSWKDPSQPPAFLKSQFLNLTPRPAPQKKFTNSVSKRGSFDVNTIEST
ncbi:MAG TPA: hypothetical protein P5121_33800, partial [Caldilineaceae bacterium]|nr:hypothetical protein [Caldilineaceae bacterium]